jgi:hypothetical protein
MLEKPGLRHLYRTHGAEILILTIRLIWQARKTGGLPLQPSRWDGCMKLATYRLLGRPDFGNMNGVGDHVQGTGHLYLFAGVFFGGMRVIEVMTNHLLLSRFTHDQGVLTLLKFVHRADKRHSLRLSLLRGCLLRHGLDAIGVTGNSGSHTCSQHPRRHLFSTIHDFRPFKKETPIRRMPLRYTVPEVQLESASAAGKFIPEPHPTRQARAHTWATR